MSVYDVKIESLEDLPPLKGVFVLSDCDETLFEHGTTNLYPDVEQSLREVGQLALVSANPDVHLMRQRQEILRADIGVAAHRPVWYKGRLFSEVAQQLGGQTDSIVIMGDRSIADVGIAKFIFERHGYNTLGVRVARQDKSISLKADYVLRSGFAVCSTLVKLARQDEHFRPRDSEGQKIAESFLAQEH